MARMWLIVLPMRIGFRKRPASNFSRNAELLLYMSSSSLYCLEMPFELLLSTLLSSHPSVVTFLPLFACSHAYPSDFYNNHFINSSSFTQTQCVNWNTTKRNFSRKSTFYNGSRMQRYIRQMSWGGIIYRIEMIIQSNYAPANYRI